MANEGTPVRLGAVSVPYGHVIGHEKWKGSLVAQGIQGNRVNRKQNICENVIKIKDLDRELD